jgi:hypothetical protein
MFGRASKDTRKIVYIGDPDPGTIDTLATKGSVFCVCQPGRLLQEAIRVSGESFKAVRVEDYEESIYEDDWWGDGDVDLVFVHKSAESTDVLQRAMDLLKPDGVMCGQLPILPVFSEGAVGVYQDAIWGIHRHVYEEALRANGKAVAT